MTQATEFPNQFDLVAPAQRFTQGGRYVYSFVLDLRTLDRLLPVRVEERIAKAEDANRPLTLSHAKDIQEYLEKQEKWVFGTLMLGIDPDAIEFQPWQDVERAVVVGQLRVRAAEAIKIFDGQHRRYAIKDVLKSLSEDLSKERKLSSLKEASVPVMLYAEYRIDALRQMFADAAQTKSIERNTLTQFNRRDAFNRAVEQLLEISEFLKGRVEMERASVARTSPNIISVNQLADTLRAIEVGIKGRVSKERNNEYLTNVDELVDRCWAWSDEFMPAVREEYDDLLVGEIDNSEIPEMRSRTMAFNATVIRILAGCYHEWTKGCADWQPLADFIRAASLRPGAGEGTLLVDAGAVIPGGVSPIGRQAQMVDAVDYIVRQAKAGGNN
jgi:DGQHR domain-containing protein